MGYCIYARDLRLHIKQEDIAAAFKAAKAKLSQRWYSQINNFDALLFEAGYEAEYDEIGNIVGIHYCGEKLGDDEILWSAIAPYVSDGDYLEFEGEDLTLWRWIFRNGEMKEIFPTILWEDSNG